MNEKIKMYMNREFLLSNKGKILKAAAIVLVSVAAFTAFMLGGGNDKKEELRITENKEATTVITEPVEVEKIYVDVGGAVKEPKVVELDMDSRVIDAIKAAGGLTDKADTSQINQAAFLNDGEKIYVPEVGEDMSDISHVNAGTNGLPGVSAKVDLNTATSDELQTLNGVGPATAEKILQYRNDVGYFKSIEELKNVNGIGDKTFENLKEYIKV